MRRAHIHPAYFFFSQDSHTDIQTPFYSAILFSVFSPSNSKFKSLTSFESYIMQKICINCAFNHRVFNHFFSYLIE